MRHFILDANPKFLTNRSMTANSFLLFTSSALFSSAITYSYSYDLLFIQKDNKLNN